MMVLFFTVRACGIRQQPQSTSIHKLLTKSSALVSASFTRYTTSSLSACSFNASCSFRANQRRRFPFCWKKDYSCQLRLGNKCTDCRDHSGGSWLAPSSSYENDPPVSLMTFNSPFLSLVKYRFRSCSSYASIGADDEMLAFGFGNC
jgi:hypothetical protein